MKRIAGLVVVLAIFWSEQTIPAQTQGDAMSHSGSEAHVDSASRAPIGAAGSTVEPSLRYATREVRYHSRDIIELHARLRFTTLIELPQSEKIMEATSGDKDFWVIDVMNNVCFIHPSREGSSTDLNLITDKGNIYSFVISDVTESGGQPDLKVIITPSEPSNFVVSAGSPQYVPAPQLEQAKQQLAKVQASVGSAIDEYRSKYPLTLKFDYQFKRDKAPFRIQAIYHDDKFTYIKSSATEKFALYELHDGKPTFTYYEVRDGTYVIPKVLDSGYVEVGKARLKFMRKE